MKIVLSGVETNNKGAELMLYAILQEIERKHPDATVYLSRNRILQGLDYVKTSLAFRYIPCEKLEQILHLSGIFGRLKIPSSLMPHVVALGKVDYYIDGSGFRFSDKFKLSERSASILQSQLSAFKRNGTKIIFLPQAFGPFEKKASRAVLSVVSNNATLLMPREKVSLDYIKTSGLVDMKKVKMFTDFTSLVEGIFSPQYARFRNGICIIPNRQMIDKGAISKEGYLALLKSVIDLAKNSGKIVYLLNHEGKKDEQLCDELKNELPEDISCVSGLNALEIKGLISSAYLVITSRFHGLASSLNSGVPSLAMSWSHKYEELFYDYKMTDCVLPLDNLELTCSKITEFLKEETNKAIRDILSKQVPHIKEETKNMWECVWSC